MSGDRVKRLPLKFVGAGRLILLRGDRLSGLKGNYGEERLLKWGKV